MISSIGLTPVVGSVPIMASDESVDPHVYDILSGDIWNIVDNFIRKIEGQIKRWFFIIDTLFPWIGRCTVLGFPIAAIFCACNKRT